MPSLLPRSLRLKLPPLALLLLAACATAPAAGAPDAPPPDPLELAHLAALNGDRAMCVSEVVLAEAQQTARRAGRAGNASPLTLSAEAEWQQDLGRRAMASHQRDVMRALRINASSPLSGQLWAQQVLANSIYVNPADPFSYSRMRPGGVTTLEATATSLQRERLMATERERVAIVAQDPEAFRALAEAYRDVMSGLVAAEGGADDPRLVPATAAVATLVRRSPALDQAYQDEFTLEFNFGGACGPAPFRPDAATRSNG